jgi:uncharacterized protein YbjT (DUF2867 family)
MRIAIAGATGRAGRHVVDVVAERGHEPIAMSRAAGVDIVTGAGLDAALVGVDVIIDVATGPSPEEQPATAFFTCSARNLQTHGARAGARRIVGASIIGADLFTGGYGAAKVAHEEQLAAGPVPVRILRAAQFHEFVEELMGWGRDGDAVRLPRMRTQLVAARTVAEALVELATDRSDEGDRLVSEIAGPREERLVEVAALVASRRSEPLTIEEVEPADHDSRLMASGDLLPGPSAALAGPTFEDWLAATA